MKGKKPNKNCVAGGLASAGGTSHAPSPTRNEAVRKAGRAVENSTINKVGKEEEEG